MYNNILCRYRREKIEKETIQRAFVSRKGFLIHKSIDCPTISFIVLGIMRESKKCRKKKSWDNKSIRRVHDNMDKNFFFFRICPHLFL